MAGGGTFDKQGTVTGGGQEIVGGILSAIVTVLVHGALAHPFNEEIRVNVNVPQVSLATTFTVGPVVEPEIVAFPEILHCCVYPALSKALYTVVEPGQTGSGPVILQVGNGNTTTTTFIVPPGHPP